MGQRRCGDRERPAVRGDSRERTPPPHDTALCLVSEEIRANAPRVGSGLGLGPTVRGDLGGYNPNPNREVPPAMVVVVLGYESWLQESGGGLEAGDTTY